MAHCSLRNLSLAPWMPSYISTHPILPRPSGMSLSKPTPVIYLLCPLLAPPVSRMLMRDTTSVHMCLISFHLGYSTLTRSVPSRERVPLASSQTVLPQLYAISPSSLKATPGLIDSFPLPTHKHTQTPLSLGEPKTQALPHPTFLSPSPGFMQRLDFFPY